MAVVIPAADQPIRKPRLLHLRGRPAEADKLLISQRPGTPFAESFRLLALNVSTMLADATEKALLVMSAHPGDGRSLVVANLATALAEHARVLVVDREQHAPGAVSALLQAQRSRTGELPAWLSEAVTPSDNAQIWLMGSAPGRNGGRQNGVRVEAAPGVDAAPDGLTTAIQAATKLGATYTIVDSPAALTSSDAFALAKSIGNVLYVVRQRAQDMEVHRQMRAQLDLLGARILGLVVNEF